MSNAYQVSLTGPQLRVMHECLSMVMNDPDWCDMIGGAKDYDTLARAHGEIMRAWRDACRAESTPAH